MSQVPNSVTENDFDNPLELLSGGHRRILGFLELMLRVTRFGRGGAMNKAQRHGLESGLVYLQQATPLLIADEEYSLFPLVRRRARDGDARAEQCLPIMEHLEADHAVAGKSHAVIHEIASRWLQDNALSDMDLEFLADELTALHAFYAAHIAVEDKQLIALANEVLPAYSVERLGREMAARRGLDFSSLPAGESRGLCG